MTDFDTRCEKLDREGISYTIKPATKDGFYLITNTGDWWLYDYNTGKELG